MARKDYTRYIPGLDLQPRFSERWMERFAKLEEASLSHVEILQVAMDQIDAALNLRGLSIAEMSVHSIKVPDLRQRRYDTAALRWIPRNEIHAGLWRTLATSDVSIGALLHLNQSSGEKSSLRMIEGAICQAELKCAWIKAALIDLRAGWHPTECLILRPDDEHPSKADMLLLDQATGSMIRGRLLTGRHQSATASLPWPTSRDLPAPADVSATSWVADMIAEVARTQMLVRLTP